MGLHDIWRGSVMPLSGLAVSIGRNDFDPPAPVVPVFDAHIRSLVLHDSGAPVHSGGITFKSSSNRLELIASNSGALPISAIAYFRTIDGAGSTTWTQAAAVTNTFNTITNSRPQGMFVVANSEVQINASGTYEFDWNISFQHGGVAAFTSNKCWLEHSHPAGAFVEVLGTASFAVIRNATTGDEMTNRGSTIIEDVGVGHKFRIRSQLTLAATGVQIANACYLKIKKLY